MPKKKNKKGKQAASVAVNDSSHIPKRTVVGSLLKKKQLDDHDKIGDEKAQLQYFKNEAKRAWVSFVVCLSIFQYIFYARVVFYLLDRDIDCCIT